MSVEMYNSVHRLRISILIHSVDPVQTVTGMLEQLRLSIVYISLKDSFRYKNADVFNACELFSVIGTCHELDLCEEATILNNVFFVWSDKVYVVSGQMRHVVDELRYQKQVTYGGIKLLTFEIETDVPMDLERSISFAEGVATPNRHGASYRIMLLINKSQIIVCTVFDINGASDYKIQLDKVLSFQECRKGESIALPLQDHSVRHLHRETKWQFAIELLENYECSTHRIKERNLDIQCLAGSLLVGRVLKHVQNSTFRKTARVVKSNSVRNGKEHCGAKKVISFDNEKGSGDKKKNRWNKKKWEKTSKEKCTAHKLNVPTVSSMLESKNRDSARQLSDLLFSPRNKVDIEVLKQFVQPCPQNMWVCPAQFGKGKKGRSPQETQNGPVGGATGGPNLPIQVTEVADCRTDFDSIVTSTTSVFGRRRAALQETQNGPVGGATGGPHLPIQVTDVADCRTDFDSIVTSTTSVFGRRRAALPTTNLMSSVTSERTIRTKIDGLGLPRDPVLFQPAHHPQYSELRARQESFGDNWQEMTRHLTPRMATHGFFATGCGDLVRCYQCGIGLRDWREDDHPLNDHIKASPECHFLKLLLGKDELYARKERLLPAASGSSQSGADQNLYLEAKRPDMAKKEARLNTFQNWPSNARQNPKNLAEAGLYYTGVNDLCRCFCCGGGLQRWDIDDNPWLEHARLFPCCRYVIQVKGSAYVEMIQVAVAEEEAELEVPGMLNLSSQDLDPLRTDAARKIKEMGYSEASVLLAVHEFNGSNRTTRELKFTAEDLVQILIGRQERGEPIEPTETLMGDAADPFFSENRRLKYILKCKMCQQNDCKILFMPRTHHRLFEFCAQNVEHCTKCGQKIEEKLKTFMS